MPAKGTVKNCALHTIHFLPKKQTFSRLPLVLVRLSFVNKLLAIDCLIILSSLQWCYNNFAIYFGYSIEASALSATSRTSHVKLFKIWDELISFSTTRIKSQAKRFFNVFRGGSRATATSKMERFGTTQ